jgi:hypothetical protein
VILTQHTIETNVNTVANHDNPYVSKIHDLAMEYVGHQLKQFSRSLEVELKKMYETRGVKLTDLYVEFAEQ